MIKFFRKIRQNRIKENKVNKYLIYAIGEVVLVVIGILIALSINNWNQKQIEKKQIQNIYARIVKDFNQTSAEIERDIISMDITYPLMQDINKGNISRDSLLTNLDYFKKYFGATTGYPDIQIIDTGIRLLESKIELNYELNNEVTEALVKLYSQYLFEIEVDTRFLENRLFILSNYIIEKGVRVDFRINKNRESFINMVFEDNNFKNYFFAYSNQYRGYRNWLKKFKTDGEVLMEKIKAEYKLE